MATVSITCPACKKSFKGREEFLGKRVKCPGCGEAFVAQKPPESAEDAAAALLMAGESANPAPPKEYDPLDDIFSQDANPYDVTTVQIKARCPNCANEMASEDAIICLFCGYNTQLRKVGETKKVLAATGTDWAKHTTPGILNVIGIALITLILILYVNGFAAMLRGNDWWLWYILNGEPTHLWVVMMALAAMWVMGNVAFKRLIVEPVPPEQQLD